MSPHAPLLSDIEKNVASSFRFVEDIIQEKGVRHQVLMLDELKVEGRLRWDPRSNHILGVCREHGSKTSLEFKSKDEVELLIESLEKKEVHMASEVSNSHRCRVTCQPD